MNINRRISAQEAREKMRANPNAVILDVRTAREFATGKVAGAILLPDYAIRDKAHTVLPNKNALILVYCHSGQRSHEAVYELISMGYTNVYDFGGINVWPYERE
ncbi:MAG: rhodanese-like domain-containing protein [Defluviitaleaceae bacterium]|nr:rhodanese-like domain-containing protein [Defluviitaleaceae bacterium]